MSESNVPDAYNDLSPDEIARRLSGLGLVLCEADGVLICVHCKYSLQLSGQTVSKHLWEKHSVPAKDRAGLNGFVRGLELRDPDPTLVFPRERRRLAGFAHGQTIVALLQRVAFPSPQNRPCAALLRMRNASLFYSLIHFDFLHVSPYSEAAIQQVH